MKKEFTNKIVLLFFSVVLGIILAMQMKYNNDEYTLVSLNSIHMMKNEVENSKREINNLREMIKKRQKELENFKKAIDENGNITSILKKELEEAKLLAGMADVHGPGIMVLLDDNEEEYREGEDLNLYIVHDMDVVLIVNDLLAAGAEAISINGKRLTSASGIICAANVIIINGEEIGAPFIIKAIGDPKLLSAAINAPNTYGWELKEYFGIIVETKQSDDIPIPRYLGEPEFRYAKPIEKEGE